jgi:hypothetical protein
MKKIDKIFVGLILLEIVILIIHLLFLREFIVVACDITDYSLLNPFLVSSSNCLLPAFKPIFNPFIYLIIDILILTIISYIIYLVIRKIRKK